MSLSGLRTFSAATEIGPLDTERFQAVCDVAAPVYGLALAWSSPMDSQIFGMLVSYTLDNFGPPSRVSAVLRAWLPAGLLGSS